ncbi:hypothetical protein JW865_07545 [Candidatus Bathyarchaeota archaeon]|nr:hypothetical protein [Candidatus Bathyarchaeota archaeon]
MLKQTKLYGWTFLFTGVFLTAAMLKFIEAEGNRILITHFPIFIAGPIICSISLALIKPFTKKIFLLSLLLIISGVILLGYGINNTLSISLKEDVFSECVNNVVHLEGPIEMITFFIGGLCLIFLGVTEFIIGIFDKQNNF